MARRTPTTVVGCAPTRCLNARMCADAHLGKVTMLRQVGIKITGGRLAVGRRLDLTTFLRRANYIGALLSAGQHRLSRRTATVWTPSRRLREALRRNPRDDRKRGSAIRPDNCGAPPKTRCHLQLFVDRSHYWGH